MRRNIFADKASLVLRRMLREPGHRWVVRDFVGTDGVSVGLAQAVLETVEAMGYAERNKKGAASFTLLTNPDLVIAEWVKAYSFSRNDLRTFYFPFPDVIKRIKTALAGLPYAFTLHAGANFLTSWVKTEHVHLYLDDKACPDALLGLQQRLGLKELVNGGNVHIIRPYYAHSVFFNNQKINGYPIVSKLQLYLDLYNFQPRGREHAERLKEMIKGRGGFLA
ncbi:MAG: type IV toxin-antitoxin system AbiEi family antitoxin [Candidatus Aminicenantes bacterium]|nr:type IV toxin-antitoxin system AbiEi family antitoxin [Candidatus Aminicenantes bacterium]